MSLNFTSRQMMQFTLAFVAAYAVMLLPDAALAQTIRGNGDPDALSDVLCNVVDWFQGPVGAGIATLAIIVVGLGALMGKVSWGMAIIIGLGVGVIFGAPTIVDALGGNGACS